MRYPRHRLMGVSPLPRMKERAAGRAEAPGLRAANGRGVALDMPSRLKREGETARQSGRPCRLSRSRPGPGPAQQREHAGLLGNRARPGDCRRCQSQDMMVTVTLPCVSPQSGTCPGAGSARARFAAVVIECQRKSNHHGRQRRRRRHRRCTRGGYLTPRAWCHQQRMATDPLTRPALPGSEVSTGCPSPGPHTLHSVDWADGAASRKGSGLSFP
jgi:hypothetical protein